MSTAVRAVSRPEAYPAESLLLLIVDADHWVRDLSREVAGGIGFKVFTAENSGAALRQMELQPVDVVLLDVRQSTQNGVDWLVKFKEMHPQTEIIMVSGQAKVDLPPHIRSAALRAVVSGKPARIVPLVELEKQAILDALQQLNGDKLMTARALGIGKTTLYRKLKEYGITHWDSSRMPFPSVLK